MVLSDDGKRLATGGQDGSARLWEVETGKEIRVFSDVGRRREVLGLALSHDGKWLLAEDQLWDLATGKKVHDLPHNTWVDAAAFSADDKQVVTGSWDGIARLWDVASGKEIRAFTGHTSGVAAVALSRDGKHLVTGSHDKTARLWDLATGKEIRAFKGHEWQVYSVALSADGKRLATSGNFDLTARLWDVASGKEIRAFRGQTWSVPTADMTPDAKWLVTGSADGTACLWTRPPASRSASFRAIPIAHAAWPCPPTATGSSPASARGSVELWDLAAGKGVRSLDVDRNLDWVLSVSVAGSGKRVAAVIGERADTAQVWDAAHGQDDPHRA